MNKPRRLRTTFDDSKNKGNTKVLGFLMTQGEVDTLEKIRLAEVGEDLSLARMCRVLLRLWMDFPDVRREGAHLGRNRFDVNEELGIVGASVSCSVAVRVPHMEAMAIELICDGWGIRYSSIPRRVLHFWEKYLMDARGYIKKEVAGEPMTVNGKKVGLDSYP